MRDDKLILSEIKKAFRRNASESLVDLDDQIIHKFDFTIQRFGELFRDTNRTVPPNKWSYFRFGLITAGSGEFVTGIHKFKAVKNTLIAIPARMITSSKNWTMDVDGYMALFNIDFFLQNKFTHKYIEGRRILTESVHPYIHLTGQQANEIARIFEAILSEREHWNQYTNELVAVKIIELLIVTERLFDNEQHFEDNLPSHDLVKKFIDSLESHFSKERSVGFYAEQLAVHPNYLNSLVKKHTGITAKESIQNRILIEAKYLLHSTVLSIKEISNQLGFHDPNYFSSFFTRFENMSPGNYRALFI